MTNQEIRSSLMVIRELRRKARVTQQAARDAEQVAKLAWFELHQAILDLEDRLRLEDENVTLAEGSE